MKAIIIGTSLSGKTTLISYLRAKTNLPLLEIDEELTRINNGQYPIDNNLKHNIFIPQIVKNILSMDNVVFFTNTDYFTPEDLENARKNGFQTAQLFLDLNELQKRNRFRVRNEGYSDLSQWLEGMVNYQIMIKERGLVNKVIEANQTTENMASQLIEFLK
jgi:dephospho-CoA kinase